MKISNSIHFLVYIFLRLTKFTIQDVFIIQYNTYHPCAKRDLVFFFSILQGHASRAVWGYKVQKQCDAGVRFRKCHMGLNCYLFWKFAPWYALHLAREKIKVQIIRATQKAAQVQISIGPPNREQRAHKSAHWFSGASYGVKKQSGEFHPFFLTRFNAGLRQ